MILFSGSCPLARGNEEGKAGGLGASGVRNAFRNAFWNATEGVPYKRIVIFSEALPQTFDSSFIFAIPSARFRH